MIELEREQHDDPTGFYGVLWTDEANEHVIAEEDGRFYVRDESGTLGAFSTLAKAVDYVNDPEVWGEVTLAPANWLRVEIERCRPGEIGRFVLEYLAEYGTAGIDPQALARRASERVKGY